jgi:CDP-glucose 4,6-dehydratase
VLGWRPAWRLDDALRETVSWYRAFYDGRDMADVTRRQIAAYVERQATG